MTSVPKSRNGGGPAPLKEKERGVALVRRVTSWVDVVVNHLISDHGRRALIQRSREIDDRLERAAHKLARRQRTRGRE